jgi:hypothetical protein
MLGQMTVLQTLEQYHNSLKQRLDAPKTLIFLDTNILAYTYRLFPSAREEFLEWFKELARASRLKIPAWVASEYFNRISSRTLAQEFAPNFDESSSIGNQLERVARLARLVIDDDWLSRRAPGTTRDSFLSNFDTSVADLKRHFNKLGFDRKQVEDVHESLLITLGDLVLPSDIAALCVKASQVAPHRYLHRLPPGFGDRGKPNNTYGDLITWMEILEFAGINVGNFDLAIFITNDEKKNDWTYAPKFRHSDNLRSKEGIENNDAPVIRLTDPRLIHEFKAHTTPKHAVEVISIEHAIAASSSGGANRFKHLAAALQVLQHPASPSAASLPQAPETPTLTPESHGVPVAHPTPGAEAPDMAALSFSEVALQDKGYILDSTSEIDQIIDDLKSHNWYTQNPAITRIASLAGKSFAPDACFVLGRNILQAARGNAFEAMGYIADLSSNLAKLTPSMADQVLAGLLYEVYFNCEGKFRYMPKVGYLEELFAAVKLPEHQRALAFIRKALGPYQKQLAVLPGDPHKQFDVAVHVYQPDPEKRPKYWEISDLYINGKSAFAPIDRNGALVDDIFNRTLDGVRINDFAEALERIYAIPPSMITVTVDSQVPPDARLYESAKRPLKKWQDIDSSSH